MELKIVNTCTEHYFYISDTNKEVEDPRAVLLAYVASLKDNECLALLENITEWYGDYQSTYYCEQCGDGGSEYTLSF